MDKKIAQLASLCSDDQFKSALEVTAQLKEENVLVIDVVLAVTWGIDLNLKSDRLEEVLKKKKVSVTDYNQIFENELSEMIVANISSNQESWTKSRIKRIFDKDEVSETLEKYQDLIYTKLQERLQAVDRQLVDKSLKDTFLLRKITKNKLLSEIHWEIANKVYSDDLREIKLPSFATLELFFLNSETKLPQDIINMFYLSPLGREFRKTSTKILLDLNLRDIEMLINKLTEVKQCLEKFSKE